jgi:hypothetical protein
MLTPLTNGKVGLQFSVDYTGGTEWQVQFKNVNASADEVKAVFVANGVSDAQVNEDTANYFTVRTKLVDLFPQPTEAPPTATPAVSASASASVTPSRVTIAEPDADCDPWRDGQFQRVGGRRRLAQRITLGQPHREPYGFAHGLSERQRLRVRDSQSDSGTGPDRHRPERQGLRPAASDRGQARHDRSRPQGRSQPRTGSPAPR